MTATTGSTTKTILLTKDNHKVKTCRHCGKMFSDYGLSYGYCDRCAKIDNEVFHRVKEYIWEHGTASGSEVSTVLHVSLGRIYGYLKDGRLEIPENSPIYIHCELCGKEIRYGRYCRECANQLIKDLSSVIKPELYEIGEEPKHGRMHYLKSSTGITAVDKSTSVE
jgi:predicted amidophosphoribosyltransferase